LHEGPDQIATIAINRPNVMNAFRGQTVEEMLQAMLRAGGDKNIASSCSPAPATARFAPAATNPSTRASTMAAARRACRSRNCTV
jgi:hypothetical protein